MFSSVSPCLRGEVIASIIMVAALLMGCDRAAPAASTPAKLVVSGDTHGWLTPCGCTSNQSGGLLRRATFLKQLAAKGPVIYVDAGGAPAGTSEYHRLKFAAILRGEALMGLAAHNIGASEAALGATYLKELSSKTGAPLICANATDAAGQSIAPAFRISQRIALVGLISPRFATDSVRVTDPRAALAKAIAETKDQRHLLVVLAYMPEDELQQLADASPEVDAVIGGPTGQAIAPRRSGPTLIAAATNKGKFVIEIAVDPTKQLDGRVVELNGSFADDDQQVKNLKSYLNELAERDFKPEQTGLVEALQPGTPESYRFAGSASCASCHAADQKLFIDQKHAHAFETLKGKGMHVDPACLQCHTTGYGLPGGFVTQKLTPDRIDVGCENCHGPSAEHVADPKVRTPFRAADQCVRCHDHENSPTFEYPRYWEKIRHGQQKAVMR